MRFAGKTVLITGANNPFGIGAVTARAFARAGAKVAPTYLRLDSPFATAVKEPGSGFYAQQRMKTADEVVASIREEGGTVIAVEADLAQPGSAADLFDWAERELGPVEILVNNAACYPEWGDEIFAIEAEDIDQTFAVNTRAAVLLIREFAGRHVKREAIWGRVINLSTDSAQSFGGQIIYGASKTAIEALTRSIASEVGAFGITVNTIAPGPVQTGYISNDDTPSIVETIPLGRLGTPEDIANAILFFASDESGWITGQVLAVDGGHNL